MERGKVLESENVEKFDVKLKTKPKDGVILQLHHTVRGPNGESHRIRFSTGTFNSAQEKLACIDNEGNLFIIDFSDRKFWKLTDVGPSTALHFVPDREDTLAVASAKKFSVTFIDIETGASSQTLVGHTAPVKHISFSTGKRKNFLTSSQVEAILWEYQNFTKYFTLRTYSGAQIQQILFSPGGEYLVACFQNDTVQIWKHENMKSIKQIIPNQLKHLKNIAFTMNGRAMAIAGMSPILILFSLETWTALKCIDMSKYNISGAQQIAFIPQLFDGGSNKILAILSSDCILHFLDLELLTIARKICPESSSIHRFVASPTGRYFICVLQLGEVNVYSTSYVMMSGQTINQSDTKEIKLTEKVNTECPGSSSRKHEARRLPTSATKAEIEERMRVCMDSARLRRILMQYFEYPDKFRPVIWTSLLGLPKNKSAYTALLDKGVHPEYKDIEKQFTIHSSVTLKNLKRLLSCLAHWCPLFAVTKFLPGFAFPFVKVLQKDPLLLFECVATILINNCQLWFEYAPFPPISILAIIENILSEHDPVLLNHFCKVGVTSQTYALNVLETAFSEVLTCSEWLILWDHILSNEPAFFIMAVVSYNIVQKNALKRLHTLEQLNNFFHMQNPIDKKTFLKKTYILLNETPEEIHPRTFFNKFTALEKGTCYSQFSGYPKATICLKLAKKQRRKQAKTDAPTLKDLTRKSQERIIKERLTEHDSDNRSSKSTPATPTPDYSVVEISEKYMKKQKQKSHDQVNNRGDNAERKEIKDQLIKSILYPTAIHLQRNKKSLETNSNKKEQGTLDSKNKTKKKSPERKETNHLEKEFEKIINSFTQSDLESES